jgi:DNA-binding beta-propeller fold protein YncE
MVHAHHQESQTLCPACDIGPFTRNHYFTGKLLLERDFSDEQRYYIEKLRHHHQRLHGWGVVCGLKVTPHPQVPCRDRFVCIEPGTAIDCCGHEIVVRDQECLDITRLDAIQELLKQPDKEKEHVLQICLRYRECPTEEIPVLYDECGCDDTRCAPNRILESYDVDVIVDPKEEPVAFHSPSLHWHCTVSPAHASHVALHASSRRLYAITADNSKTVLQLDTENYTVVGAHALPAKGLELAVSNDGTRVYIVTEANSGVSTDPRQLVVLDTANNMGNAPIWTLDLVGSGDSEVFLAVAPAPDNRLFALLGLPGNVLVWPTTLDNPGPTPIPTTTHLGTNLRGLVIGSDAQHAYTTDTANNRIQVLIIAGPTPGTAIPGVPGASALALVTSTAPDMLAVASQTNTNKQVFLVGLNPDEVIGSALLDHEPIALVVSPGGQWAYVLEQDGTANYVQTVNLHRLQQNLSPIVGTPFKVGNQSRQIVISTSGSHLYLPFEDDLTQDNRGGVAVLEVSEQACEDILWRHLDGCPHCDIPNCVVLATIEHYHVGDKFEAQTDPPADLAVDAAEHIARINNRKGRHVLPSTQVLTELMQCLLEHGTGGAGAQGPPGAPGKDGKDGQDGAPGQDGQDGAPGPGLEQGLTRIEALSWSHNRPHVGGTPPAPNSFFVMVKMLQGPDTPGLVIGFTDVVQVSDTIDAAHVFQVLVEAGDPTDHNATRGIVCRCPIRGRTIPVDLLLNPQGQIIVNGAGRIDTATEAATGQARGVAFLLDRQLAPIARDILASGIPELWVVLRGDFVKDRRDRAIDAEFVRAFLPTGDRPEPPLSQPLAEQLGIQGGLFESWFQIQRPQ